MALSDCLNLIDEHGRELLQHGAPEFPIACYHDDLGQQEVPWHWHDELEAAVIAGGSTVVTVGLEEHVLRAGEAFFLNSQVLHACRDHEDSGCRYHSLCFHPRLVGGDALSAFHRVYIQPLLENQGLAFLHLKPDIPWQARCIEAIEAAWQACVQEPPGHHFTVREALSRLVYLLNAHSPAAAPGPDPRRRRSAERIRTMLKFIHDGFSGPLTVADIARSAAISESECLRCFRSEIGTTPMRYLRSYRIQCAARLLEAGEEQVQEIAERCGFQDVSYFTRVFREEMGCAPGLWRRSRPSKVTC